MSRICLVDSGACARASRSLHVHRGYWHYPRYFDTKLPYNYIPIVILHISTERILGSGSCKTSCTKLKKVKIFTRATPLRSKTPNIVQRDMQIQVALCSSFGPKLIWAATGAPPRPNSEILPQHTVDLPYQVPVLKNVTAVPICCTAIPGFRLLKFSSTNPMNTRYGKEHAGIYFF